jgi:hypothetical protein
MSAMRILELLVSPRLRASPNALTRPSEDTVQYPEPVGVAAIAAYLREPVFEPK